jgi:RNA polymerase sigma-B factor
MTQTQIDQRTGYSQMHVSRLLVDALRTLRSQVQESGDRGAEVELAKTA